MKHSQSGTYIQQAGTSHISRAFQEAALDSNTEPTHYFISSCGNIVFNVRAFEDETKNIVHIFMQ